ncbi:flagellar motor switch protein FliG [Limnohabitans planktonicus]|uniref:Flagellar motor switch protein FliG n=1 Tax=Limnohabitans planktonicus II-D5 TaxID=1293045 RepID=A0A2T7UIZ0_9BURK|nr:flagellar motor switch protein FliG [Limnohabitans planktonicus]PVE44649.1 flagellar motor switch protein FliG [Limnohabitans planktonicus II-D5]
MSSLQEPGLNNAAILIMSLGEEAAAEVFKHLPPKEVYRLGETISNLRSVSRDRVEKVLSQFANRVSSQSLLVGDTSNYVRNVLKRALGEDKAGMLLDRITQGNDVSGIESLRWMDPIAVAELLKNEHPQIIAAIMVHLDNEQSAHILKAFSDRLRNDVLVRVASLEDIQPAALQDLNDVLYRSLSGRESLRKTNHGGVKSAAEIINLLGTTLENNVIEAIRSEDSDLAQKIVDMMFVFEDLLKLDNKAIQLTLKEFSTDQLVLAIKGASLELSEKILGNMSARAAQSMREDLESLGPVLLSEVEAQQKEIIKTVRQLAEDGQIVLGATGGDSYV